MWSIAGRSEIANHHTGVPWQKKKSAVVKAELFFAAHSFVLFCAGNVLLLIKNKYGRCFKPGKKNLLTITVGPC